MRIGVDFRSVRNARPRQIHNFRQCTACSGGPIHGEHHEYEGYVTFAQILSTVFS